MVSETLRTDNKLTKFMAHSAVWSHSSIQRQNTNSKQLTIEKLSKSGLRTTEGVQCLVELMNEK